MAMFSDCPACVSGNHDGHVEHWGVRPEGIIDGEFCLCRGDCKERLDEWLAGFMEIVNRRPQEREMTLRIVWDVEREDDYDHLELKRIERVSTDLTPEQTAGIAEQWAQSDRYWVDIAGGLLRVLESHTYKPD